MTVLSLCVCMRFALFYLRLFLRLFSNSCLIQIAFCFRQQGCQRLVFAYTSFPPFCMPYTLHHRSFALLSPRPQKKEQAFKKPREERVHLIWFLLQKVKTIFFSFLYYIRSPDMGTSGRSGGEDQSGRGALNYCSFPCYSFPFCTLVNRRAVGKRKIGKKGPDRRRPRWPGREKGRTTKKDKRHLQKKKARDQGGRRGETANEDHGDRTNTAQRGSNTRRSTWDRCDEAFRLSLSGRWLWLARFLVLCFCFASCYLLERL